MKTSEKSILYTGQQDPLDQPCAKHLPHNKYNYVGARTSPKQPKKIYYEPIATLRVRIEFVANVFITSLAYKDKTSSLARAPYIYHIIIINSRRQYTPKATKNKHMPNPI
jgi:hypothetical protein